jgi:hypothetical protein
MRPLRHLTPRYVYNRTKFFLYQRWYPETPWFAPDAIRALSKLLLPTDVGVEWGSGRSTAWFAKRVKHLTSVEDHAGWYEKVTGILRERGLTNVNYLHRTVDENNADASEYVAIADSFADNSLDFALVDGEARKECVMRVMPKICVGGMLILDNAQWFFDYPTYTPVNQYGKGPRDADWGEIGRRLASWRLIFTTCGTTDTLIWIRPR